MNYFPLVVNGDSDLSLTDKSVWKQQSVGPVTISPEKSVDSRYSNNTRFLYEAFGSLSLVDKCALYSSSSSSSTNYSNNENSSSSHDIRSDGNMESVITYFNNSSDRYDASSRNVSDEVGACDDRRPSVAHAARATCSYSPGTATFLPSVRSQSPASLTDESQYDSTFELQSVISESDRESLSVAISLMGPNELVKLEDEVRLIQNNVRGWLLRKNYTNLREAAKALQSAWREKKRALQISMEFMTYREKDIDSKNFKDCTDSYFNTTFSSTLPIGTAIRGITSLQAATRGMLARRSFELARKQAMASLIIQKSLFQWWSINKFIDSRTSK